MGCDVTSTHIINLGKHVPIIKPTRFFQHILEANQKEVPKVHLESWHGVVVKIQDLFMCPTID